MSDPQDSPMSDPRLVIFDCDGVLVDSESISNGVLADMLSTAGVPTTLAQARREFQGLLLSQVGVRVEAMLGRPLPDDWLAAFERTRAELFRRELEPVHGVADVLAQLHAAHTPICVASQGKLEKTRLSLELTGLHRWFGDAALFSAYSVARAKPHPDLFLHAAAAMCTEPAHCVVIEDTPSGVLGAVAAGMHVFGYAADSDISSLRRAGAETFLSMHELPALLGLA
ncbi:MAG TPA: HAD-IA family hydrolase [Solirubrobacteraceae bacterium]|nr:HAD-IA family hydrolase [Solirubrobacteraceae bacterium]